MRFMFASFRVLAINEQQSTINNQQSTINDQPSSGKSRQAYPCRRCVCAAKAVKQFNACRLQCLERIRSAKLRDSTLAPPSSPRIAFFHAGLRRASRPVAEMGAASTAFKPVREGPGRAAGTMAIMTLRTAMPT
jgi:hypothetical protein